MDSSNIEQTCKATISTEYKVTALEKLICQCGSVMKILPPEAELIVERFFTDSPVTVYKHTCEDCGNTEDKSEEYPRTILVGMDRIVRDIVIEELDKDKSESTTKIVKIIEEHAARTQLYKTE